ncbi:hypothetical protein PPERSA_09851 [Pseudocohnilembus persalinus]|uniref:t-SNARE coiled-coil homology domain-containing protein n=1 Tax=Pseudocohnilembus persalinus TaxID=266149 RepID=A0A0V0QTU7_PSEPJ|nr:hypothetical protein PPERSA_09851 [Pseudocohnilembus persalinus]|eukprot:KRX05711.1 hypothetical protein PPERSA_09851 [Pseudocohnilembus persalinus]
MMKQQVTFLLDKLYKIDKELGGKALDKKTRKKGNEFDNLRLDIQEKLFTFKKKQDERDQKQDQYGNRDQDVIRLNLEVRDLTRECQQDLENLNKKLTIMSKNRKKYTPEQIVNSDKIYQNLVLQYQNLLKKENGDFYDEENPQIKTLTEAKMEVFGNRNRNNQEGQRVKAEGIELEALDRWNKNDELMDEKLDGIIGGIKGLQGKGKQIGTGIDAIQQREKKLGKQIDNTTNTVQGQNASLKKILKHYRKPNKFCLDITMLCLFLGLIAVIYNMIK